MAVPAGRCYKCRKVTDAYCGKCQRFLCEKHMLITDDEKFCDECAPDNARQLTKKEIRNFRKAEL
jgi:hypothetical protein